MMKHYILIEGKDLVVGDIIIHNHERFCVTSCGHGAGAGSFDFGEYVWVKGYFIGPKGWKLFRGRTKEEFWTYKECPVIKEASSCKSAP